ncbi:unnamed protein product, partial [Anisakis simplex]|uniref:Uncharacterized protein n=1 Tax=Anisakis simplex TaxID=6269 RepID=A0A0M3KKK4_ANISI
MKTGRHLIQFLKFFFDPVANPVAARPPTGSYPTSSAGYSTGTSGGYSAPSSYRTGGYSSPSSYRTGGYSAPSSYRTGGYSS